MNKKRCLLLYLVMSLLLSLASCGGKTSAPLAESLPETEPEITVLDPTRFTPVDGTPTLYEMMFLESGETCYAGIYKLGDRMLLPFYPNTYADAPYGGNDPDDGYLYEGESGELYEEDGSGKTSEAADGGEDGGGEMSEAADGAQDEVDEILLGDAPEEAAADYENWISYSFRLVEPRTGKTVAQLEDGGHTYSQFFVVGDRLAAWDVAAASLDIYDRELKPAASYDLTGLTPGPDPTFRFGDVVFPCLLSAYGDEGFLCYYLTQTGEGIEKKELSLPLADPAICGLTADGRNLILSGDDLEISKPRHILWNPETEQILSDAEIAVSGCINTNRNLTITADAIGTREDYRIQAVQTFGGPSVYFRTPSNRQLVLLESGNILTYAEDYDTHTYTLDMYDSTGKSLHHLQMSLPDECFYWNHFLEFDDCLVWQTDYWDKGSQLLVWDAAACGSGQDLEQTEDPRDPDDRGGDVPELEELYARARELGDKYQVNIYIAEQMPEELEYALEPLVATWPIKECLDRLDAVMGAYPRDFFRRTLFDDYDRLHIYLVSSITGKNEDALSSAGAYVNELGGQLNLVLNGNNRESWEREISHEISHFIDRKLDYLEMNGDSHSYSSEKWNSFNPEEFNYFYSYSVHETDESWNAYEKFSDSFWSGYSLTYPTEDRAELFAEAMYQYFYRKDEYYSEFADKPVLRKKLAYYSRCIRENFDTTDWPEQLPWEYVLERYGKE